MRNAGRAHLNAEAFEQSVLYCAASVLLSLLRRIHGLARPRLELAPLGREARAQVALLRLEQRREARELRLRVLQFALALGEPRLDRFELVVVARVRPEFGDDAAQPPLRFS